MPGEVQFVYPTSEELMEIEQELQAEQTLNDPIFALFPIESPDTDKVCWEIEDNYDGMQQVRGINGQPGRVVGVGGSRYEMEPGYYGEEHPIDEREITKRRNYGQTAGFINISDLVNRKNRYAKHREIVRIRVNLWTLLTTGTFSTQSPTGQILHTDRFPLQTLTAGIAWSSASTAVPLQNFQAAQALGSGHGCSFGAGATAFMNRATFNEMMNVTNTADIAGKRLTGAATPLGLADANTILAAMDLPKIVIIDDGYPLSGTFTKYVPNDVVVIVGARPGNATLGGYYMTRNANNPMVEPGSYVQVVDSIRTTNPVPRTVSVHRGHNGGPVIFYPSAIVVMSV